MSLIELLSTISSPPNLILNVFAPKFDKLELPVVYARTCCFRSTTEVLAGGNVNERASGMGLSPDVAMRLSKEDMVFLLHKIY
jgi:hypothetical protein